MRKGARLLLGAFVVLSAALMVSGRPVAQPVPPVANGIAILYVPGPFDERYEVSAEMRLPRVSSNASWYCVWLMLVGMHDAAFGAPFVQGGLMRWGAKQYALTAFIAEAKRATPMTYDDVADLGDGWHRVALRGDAATVELLVDGKTLHRFPRETYLAGAEDVYLQIGAEVKQPGDMITASVRDVRVRRDDDTVLHPETIACSRFDRGLRFEEARGTFEAGGRFVPAAESGFDGCADFAVPGSGS